MTGTLSKTVLVASAFGVMLAAELENQNEMMLDVKDRAIQYNILKREWETNRQLYSGLLERMKEVGVAGAGEEMGGCHGRAVVVVAVQVML